MDIDIKFVQPSNTQESIKDKESGNVTDIILLQYSKAPYPMFVTELGMNTDVKS